MRLKLPVRTKLLGVFAAGTAFLLITILYTQLQGAQTLEATRLADASSLRLRTLDLALSAMQDAETGQRGFVLTGKDEYLQPFVRAVDEIDTYFVSLANLYHEDAPSLARIGEMARLKDEKLRELRTVIDLRRSRGFEPALAFVMNDEGKRLMDRIRIVMDQQIGLERLRYGELRQLSAERQQQRWLAYGALILVALVMSAFGYLSLMRQISENERLARRLEHEASHDALTGLANRRYGVDWLHRSVARARRDRTMLGVLYIDLDGFKRINDQFGHKAGDDALREVATRFGRAVRESDFLARLSGDEFLVVLPPGPVAD